MSAGIIGAKPMIHWQEQLEAAGIPCAPIHDFGQVMDQEQTHAIGIFQEVPETDLKPVGPPISFDGVRPPIGVRAPGIGEHTASVRAETREPTAR